MNKIIGHVERSVYLWGNSGKKRREKEGGEGKAESL